MRSCAPILVKAGPPSSPSMRHHVATTSLQAATSAKMYLFRCEDTNAVICNNNRKDMREGKIFFKPSNQSNFVSSLAPHREAFVARLFVTASSSSRVQVSPRFCP
ncbi:MAG: hypothetical protein H6728_01555 [Myxococcales bacterium]|nr:hypothetical protein [Myxococcales bacterium]